MSSTLVHLLVHVIFSTKHRDPLISPDNAERLYALIGGIIRNKGGSLIAAGGMPDHVHLLIQMPGTISVSDLMRDVKANASRWMRDTMALPGFAWQDGFACFSVSQSNAAEVKNYIDTQTEHHRTRPFKEELVAFLERHGVAYDPRYLVDER